MVLAELGRDIDGIPVVVAHQQDQRPDVQPARHLDIVLGESLVDVPHDQLGLHGRTQRNAGRPVHAEYALVVVLDDGRQTTTAGCVAVDVNIGIRVGADVIVDFDVGSGSSAVTRRPRTLQHAVLVQQRPQVHDDRQLAVVAIMSVVGTVAIAVPIAIDAELDDQDAAVAFEALLGQLEDLLARVVRRQQRPLQVRVEALPRARVRLRCRRRHRAVPLVLVLVSVGLRGCDSARRKGGSVQGCPGRREAAAVDGR
mmetsp:Transcript_20237/g.57454  ORF Transcript_20237/g.57454 Transcript_20237/m.57454 type:complete len:255 (-) Transcript_20237:16-780(-)